MHKYAVVFCFVLASAYASEVIEPSEALPEEGAYRFMASAVTTTTTVYVTASTTAATLVTRACATTSNVTGICRRRRGIEEQPLLLSLDDDFSPQQIIPAQPAAVEASNAAEMPKDAAQVAEAVLTKAEVESSEEAVFFEIIGLPAPCRQQRFFTSLFGLTIRYTAYSTITSTSYVPATVATKTYTVIGCTPSGFATNLC